MSKSKQNNNRAQSPQGTGRSPAIRLEIYGIVVMVFAVALFLSILSFDEADLHRSAASRGYKNLLGPVGVHAASLFLSFIGVGALLFSIFLGWLGFAYLVGRRSYFEALDIIGAILGMLSLTVLAHTLIYPWRFFYHNPGGWVGMWVGEFSAGLLGGFGTFFIFSTLGLVALVILSGKSIFELSALVQLTLKRIWGLMWRALRHGDRDTEADPSADPDTDAAPAPPPADGPASSASSEPVTPLLISEPPASREDLADDPDDDEPFDDTDWDDAPFDDVDVEDPADSDIQIVESAAMRRTRELTPEAIDLLQAEQISFLDDDVELKPYEYPTLSFLDYRPPETNNFDREPLRKNAQILEAKLADYRVKGKVVAIHPGPVVTMYEFRPAPGVKVAKIAGLSNDLAMALSARSIRIVAPIPGKDVVGIEIPNHEREIVWLKEILSDPTYTKAKSHLTLALGKDIVGNPSCMDLAKAPHLLVAGATGAGKSVAINSFIVSLLYKAKPSEVRLIMVDPKILELSIYEGIPHLLLPVVTDPTEASIALKWAVKEMDRRYHLMADMGVRDLAGYNEKVEELIADPSQRWPERLRLAKLKRETKGVVDEPGIVYDAGGTPISTLPSIVVIIDELADLMMVASKEVEQSIARLAQKARASGIHLILATQRPSVDVITGLIKANFPTRISFRVAQAVDSRTIIDQKGAEALLGMGDMLYLPPGQGPQRVHGCYVSEDEVHRIVDHLKAQGSPEYDMGILESDEEDEDAGGGRDEDEDPLYDEALRIAATERRISASYLQRRLSIGYNRAARIVEQMERNKVIGPSDGTSRPREVYIDPL